MQVVLLDAGVTPTVINTVIDTIIDTVDTFTIIQNETDEVPLDSQYSLELQLVTEVVTEGMTEEMTIILQTINFSEFLGHFLTENSI